jgi:hypothetical protein
MGSWIKHLLGAVLLLAGGVGLTWYNWYLALSEGKFYPKLAMLGPPFLLFGLVMLVTPPGMLSQPIPESNKHKLTPVGWLVVVGSIGLGLFHWGLFEGWWGQQLLDTILERFGSGSSN